MSQSILYVSECPRTPSNGRTNGRTEVRAARSANVHAVAWTQSRGCGDSCTEREFPPDKVYRRDDRGIVGVESFGLRCAAFVIIHTVLDVRSVARVPRSCTPALVPEMLTALPSVLLGDRILDALTVFHRRGAEG
jgi:hypothetical protein